MVAGGSTQLVEVWQKSGAKSFVRLSQKSVPGFASSLVAVDMNRDGKLDLVVALSDQTNLAVLAGQGAGGFGTAVTVPSGTTPRWLDAIDTNCDGMSDIVASSATENKLALLFGTQSGTLAAPRIIDLSAHQNGVVPSLAVADVNFDGLADLVVGSTQSPAYLLISNVSP